MEQFGKEMDRNGFGFGFGEKVGRFLWKALQREIPSREKSQLASEFLHEFPPTKAVDSAAYQQGVGYGFSSAMHEGEE